MNRVQVKDIIRSHLGADCSFDGRKFLVLTGSTVTLGTLNNLGEALGTKYIWVGSGPFGIWIEGHLPK